MTTLLFSTLQSHFKGNWKQQEKVRLNWPNNIRTAFCNGKEKVRGHLYWERSNGKSSTQLLRPAGMSHSSHADERKVKWERVKCYFWIKSNYFCIWRDRKTSDRVSFSLFQEWWSESLVSKCGSREIWPTQRDEHLHLIIHPPTTLICQAPLLHVHYQTSV